MKNPGSANLAARQASAKSCRTVDQKDLIPRYRQRLATLQDALRAGLEFHGANSRHSTHGWHPFPAKFPPQLPAFFIERLSVVGDVVLDPMFGSGTTLMEAARLDRRAVGCDIDPLARLIVQAKSTPLDPVATLRAGRAIVARAKRLFLEGRDDLQRSLDERFDAKTRAFVDYWFLPQQQLELTGLSTASDQCTEVHTRPFFEMVLSSTIIAKSGGVSLARDLAHTRPHRVLDKQPKSALDAFQKRLDLALSSFVRATSQQVEIRSTGADRTGLPASSVDLIVTSPPYANNAIDYMRAHKFSLVWLGWPIAELSRIRSGYLGHDAASVQKFDDLPRQCEDTITMLHKLDEKEARALRRYFGEMRAVIVEMRRVLKRGGTAVIVVGSSILRGLDVETHKGLAAIGEAVGLVCAGIGVRRLDRDKRMMPARWGGAPHSQIEQRMHEEHVIGLLKP